jgi:hypothetical protein
MVKTGSGDLVGSNAAISGGDTPLGLDQLGFEQPLKRGIERTLFHLQQVVGSLLDVLDQSVSVGRLPAKGLEDHHFEGAGEEIARG